MKHDRNEVEEKQTETPARGSECRQQHKDPDWDRTKHPEKAHEQVSLVNVSQSRNDAKHNCDGVARFAFGSLGGAACPIAPIAACRVFWQ